MSKQKLSERDVSVISSHILNIFKDGELGKKQFAKKQIAKFDRPEEKETIVKLTNRSNY